MRPVPRRQPVMRPVILMVIVAILFTMAQHRIHRRGGMSIPENAARRLVWPVQRLLVGVGSVGRNTVTAIFLGSELARENRELKERVAELEADKTRMLTYYHENIALKQKLGFEPPGRPEGIAARVVGWSSGGDRRRITIRAGRDRELEVGRIVVTAAGLVGRIIEAQGRYAEVVLLIEPGHAVAGVIQRRPRDQGMVYSAPCAEPGETMLQLSKVRRGSDIRVGDTVLSSGLGGVYPPNLRIGIVERIERSSFSGSSIVAYVRPFVDFNHLDFVLVLPRAE
ncbi:MAG: rod shape-determining protein MreC [Armatimonadetes bacterium]|nr:rod shape-determining protein MreC [Armatimonadota bacterium]